MKMVCISASNMLNSQSKSVSYFICEKVSEILESRRIPCEILDLREFHLSPCVGCGKCFDSRRCCCDMDFNTIYEKIANAGSLLIVSPHYAPIPAKLCMLLEKMEEITFLHWWKDNTYQSELFHLPAGIVSHGGGGEWALKSYKSMVNDTIANALDTIQCQTVPYNELWNTGPSLPVARVREEKSIFPVQEYDWPLIESKLREYVDLILQTSQLP